MEKVLQREGGIKFFAQINGSHTCVNGDGFWQGLREQIDHRCGPVAPVMAMPRSAR